MVGAYSIGLPEVREMRIVVGIKWVPNTMAVRFDPKTGTLIRAGVPSVVNPHDLDAVEFALDMKDRYGGEVIAISMAPPSALKGLEHVMGMGVDRAILISDRAFAGADTLATSYTLAKAIERIEREFGRVDLMVFGQETIDSSTAHIGAQTASWLKLPYLYYVWKAELLPGGRTLRVERRLEEEIDVYEVPLPAVLGIAMKSREPRPVRLSHKIRVKTEKDSILVWNNKYLGLDPMCIGLRGSPTIVSKITFTPEVPRKKEVFTGRNVRDAVKWLIKKLVEEDIIEVEGGLDE